MFKNFSGNKKIKVSFLISVIIAFISGVGKFSGVLDSWAFFFLWGFLLLASIFGYFASFKKVSKETFVFTGGLCFGFLIISILEYLGYL